MSKTRKWYAKSLYLVFALALVVGLAVGPVAAVPEAPVAEAPVAPASPDVSSVWVQLDDYSDGGTSVGYYVYFTPGVDLTAALDKITVLFPAESGGSDTNASSASVLVDPDGDAVKKKAANSATVTASALVVTITTPKDLTAGTEVRLEITGVTNPTIPSSVTTKDYTLQVYTTQETTPVTSSAYTIGASDVSTVVFASVGAGTTDKQAGKAGCYNVTFTTDLALVKEVDTISITLPVGTTMPSSISTSYVHLEGGTGGTNHNDAKSVTVNGRVVTICPYDSFAASADVTVSFNATGANIKNPSVASVMPAGTPYSTARDVYKGFVKTSRDLGLMRDGTGFNVYPRAATKLGFSSTSASLVGISQKSAAIILNLQDKYGNTAYDSKDTEVEVSSNSPTGEFYKTAYSTTLTLTYGTATTDTSETFYYRDSTEGTATITVSGIGGLVGDTDYPYWTDTATWDITVEPAHEVKLYDASNNLVGTYTTISKAADNAQSKYTIKVGPGTYKEASTVNLDIANVTVESTEGAATTIVDAASFSSATNVFLITADYVTVKGLTFQDSKTTTQVQSMITFNSANDGDNTTIEDCVFDLTAGYADDTAITFSAVMVSVTISGCTFNVEASLNAIDMDVAATSLAIKNCTFNGSGTGSLTGYGYDGDGAATATFTSCTFDGTITGIDLDSGGTVTVDGCTFTNGSKSTVGAIDVGTTGMTKLTIYGSTFEDNAGYSIYGRDTSITAGEFVVRFNNFINNVKGMKSSDTTAANTYADLFSLGFSSLLLRHLKPASLAGLPPL